MRIRAMQGFEYSTQGRSRRTADLTCRLIDRDSHRRTCRCGPRSRVPGRFLLCANIPQDLLPARNGHELSAA
jgi:hypothetical protein